MFLSFSLQVIFKTRKKVKRKLGERKTIKDFNVYVCLHVKFHNFDQAMRSGLCKEKVFLWDYVAV
jgi:hypothetical protein